MAELWDDNKVDEVRDSVVEAFGWQIGEATTGCEPAIQAKLTSALALIAEFKRLQGENAKLRKENTNQASELLGLYARAADLRVALRSISLDATYALLHHAQPPPSVASAPPEIQQPPPGQICCERCGGRDWMLDHGLCQACREKDLNIPPPSVASPPVAWQPIETAPRDGTIFLGRKGNTVCMTQAGKHYVKWPHNEGGPTFRDVWNEISEDSICPWEPTHWMPITPLSPPLASQPPPAAAVPEVEGGALEWDYEGSWNAWSHLYATEDGPRFQYQIEVDRDGLFGVEESSPELVSDLTPSFPSLTLAQQFCEAQESRLRKSSLLAKGDAGEGGGG